MKKLLAAILAVSMIAFTACAPKEGGAGEVTPPAGGEEVVPDESGQPEASTDGAIKIGIITGTVSQGEEEFQAAQAIKAKYEGSTEVIVETATYPDNFTQEAETLISNVVQLAANGCQAIIMCQAVPGTSASVDKVREQYPDVLFIAGTMAEDPMVLASKADIIMNADEVGMGKTIMEQAAAMGAETFVHYSFPRHMGVELIAGRFNELKANAERLGIEFVDATAPDPTSEAGTTGAQQFILGDVPQQVEKYGKNTAFFSTNCSMQEPLITSILEQGALYPQQCCPSPYHGYPEALGIGIPEEKKGDIEFMKQEITSAIKEKGGTGRFSTWPVPMNMLYVEAGFEYAKGFLQGDITERNDRAALEEIMKDILDGSGEIYLTTYVNAEDETKTADNFYLVLSDYIKF